MRDRQTREEDKLMLDALKSRIAQVLTAGVESHLFPGAVVCVSLQPSTLLEIAVGNYTYKSDSFTLQIDTIFDIASLTKVIATTISVLQLVERGKLSLDDPVKRYIAAYKTALKEKVTIWHLLTHTSGLRAHAGLEYECIDGRQLIEAVSEDPLIYVPGQRYLYTDLGFILLGHIIEKITQQTLDVYAREQIFDPLGMNHTTYVPPPEWISRIAPTENDAAWRRSLLQGQVHDEKAFLLDGVAGNAGVFSTARDLCLFARSLLQCMKMDQNFVISRRSVGMMIQNQTATLGIKQGLGWLLDQPFMGRMSPGAFGHTGFTGTSIAVNPSTSAVCVILTNCVHPTRPDRANRVKILELRSRIANLTADYSRRSEQAIRLEEDECTERYRGDEAAG